MIRTFIAIPIPKSISFFLGKIQEELKATRVKAAWTKAASLHLTLRFLGDTPEENVKQISQAMKATANACAPFTLSVEGVGVFPSIKKARVIWAGATGQTDRLKRIQRTLEKNLEQVSFPADTKQFSPHFTLGRFKERPDRTRLVKIIQTLGQYRSEPCRIESMVLFKSDLYTSGAVHTPLFEAMFTQELTPG